MLARFVRKSFFSLHQPGHSWCTAHSPNEGVKHTIYINNNTTSAANPGLCLSNKTPPALPSSWSSTIHSSPVLGHTDAAPAAPGGLGQHHEQLLLCFFTLFSGQKAGKGNVTINPKGLSQTHRCVQVFTFALISHETWMAK